MTTKVTVDAHAGWPVEVQEIGLDNDGNEVTGNTVTVQPYTTQDFYIHSTKLIKVTEVQANAGQPPVDNDHVAEGSEKFPE